MLKGYRYRIYPTSEQAAYIDRMAGCCRFVYNLALETKIRAYKDAGVNLSSYDLQKQLTELKNDCSWLRLTSSASLGWSIDNMETAFKRFYKGAGFPKFKSKKGKQSFDCLPLTKTINWDNKTLSIPKIKNIPIILSRPFNGEVRGTTIIKTVTGKYFVSILVRTSMQLPTLKPIDKQTTIGIDTGIKSFVISSDGRTFEANRKLKDNLKRLKVLQNRTSRKKKGSKNRKKANKAVAILHEKITNKRLDYIHKVTHNLTHYNQVASICIEDLNVSGLLKNHKIAQAMQDVSLSKFYEILAYKCRWQGINLIKINRFAPSSKRCSNCGSIKDKLTLDEREWVCLNCGTSHDRDENAAENIKWYGLETIFKNNTPMDSRGEPAEPLPIGRALNQE